jgi:hypothetical protein
LAEECGTHHGRRVLGQEGQRSLSRGRAATGCPIPPGELQGSSRPVEAVTGKSTCSQLTRPFHQLKPTFCSWHAEVPKIDWSSGQRSYPDSRESPHLHKLSRLEKSDRNLDRWRLNLKAPASAPSPDCTVR